MMTRGRLHESDTDKTEQTPQSSDTVLDISTVRSYISPFTDCFKRNTQEFFRQALVAQRRRGVLAGVFLDSNHLLCPSGGVWAEPSWFPFRDSGWLRPVIRRRGNKLLSGLCLCSRASLFHATLALPFFSFCVCHPSNYFKHFRGPLPRASFSGGLDGWGRLVAWLAGW